MKTRVTKAVRTHAMRVPIRWRIHFASSIVNLLMVGKSENGWPMFRILAGPARGLCFYLPNKQRWMALSFSLRLNEPEVTNILQTRCQPGSVVFDLGANLGYHTLNLSRLVGTSGRVEAFEADPDSAAMLQKTIAYNKIKNTSVQPYAVTDSAGQAEFISMGMGDGLAHLAHIDAGDPHTNSNRTRKMVSTIAIDDFVFHRQIGRVDLIKIDIEGAEILAFKGMEKTLRNLHPTIVCELNGSMRLEDGMRLLQQYGYACHVLNSGPSFNILAM